ncbi:MAG TPA: 2-C-methyl-D-erythritol 4-phosphate cytidylyltransferase, partial [Steroidobacteraceae bacterium]|nr:2-C-methyl-D-erythritol 4-phosphate cytidylyltransferase [Steroidobacteraceae bacterium]
VVVIAADDARWPVVERALADRRLRSVPGGAERADSVWHGLAALQPAIAADDWVLVHDAARPCLSVAELETLLHELAQHEAGGLLAVPLADTLKRAVGDSPWQSAKTVDRSGLWRALTPQMFRYALLRRALEEARAAGRTPTDEAQAIEWTGRVPQIVVGDVRNIKVTTAADLELVAALLAARSAAEPR